MRKNGHSYDLTDLPDYEKTEERLEALEELFSALREEQEPLDLWPVVQALNTYFSLEASLRILSDEHWAGLIQEPRVNFKFGPSAEVTMRCHGDILLIASASGIGCKTKIFKIIVRRPDSPEMFGLLDIIYAEEEHLPCLISAIYEGIVRRKITHDEVLRLAYQIKENVNITCSTFQSLASEFKSLVEEMELNHELEESELTWTDGYVCLESSLRVFKEASFLQARFYAELRVTIYGDGHVRLERDRRDVGSPREAIALMVEELTSGRAVASIFWGQEYPPADDPESVAGEEAEGEVRQTDSQLD